ncbi:MAG: hypothetical protein AAF967_14865, partial [Pseudomonadota bacterium]
AQRKQSSAIQANVTISWIGTEVRMAFKPNYNFQKAERDRAKVRKKQEKLQRLQEESDKRKAERVEQADPETQTPTDPGEA